MSGFFIKGERKTRPGLYKRYENWGNVPVAGVDDGKCAAVFRSNWGPLGRPTVIENFANIARFYGEGGTTEVPMEQFRGGARRVFCMRLGDEAGSTPGAYQILDADGEAVIQLALIYPGSREFNITIRPTLADPNRSELLILEDTTAIERITFDTTAGIDQVASLLSAVAATGSAYFKLTDLTPPPVDPENPVIYVLATVDQDEITPGTDPVINVAAYTAAYDALEISHWNVLSIDTDDLNVHMMTQMYLNRVYQGGGFLGGYLVRAVVDDGFVRVVRFIGQRYKIAPHGDVGFRKVNPHAYRFDGRPPGVVFSRVVTHHGHVRRVAPRGDTVGNGFYKSGNALAGEVICRGLVRRLKGRFAAKLGQRMIRHSVAQYHDVFHLRSLRISWMCGNYNIRFGRCASASTGTLF